MSKVKKIKKDKITAMLNFLIERYQVFAPTTEDGLVFNFQEIKNSGEAKLDFYNTKEPAKKLFFAQCETLFSFSKDGKVEAPKLKQEKQRIIFGLRPCDAKSLAILDRVFGDDDYNDPYYLEKRNNTIIFTLGCTDPQNSCFCTSLGFGPGSKDGSDVFVCDLGDSYLFEGVTEKGKQLIEKIPGVTNADEKDIAKAREAAKKTEGKINREVEMEGFAERLAELFDNSIWDEIHQKCIACGACTYICPTCHCFDILDQDTENGGERIRIWDSCMYPQFTLEASGHNPRATSKGRMRQRIMHKFSYFMDNHKMFACVGCGRCVRACPAGMNILKAIEKIKEVK